MDIFSYLKNDHRNISDMMEQILFLRAHDERYELFMKIEHQLLLHGEAEQATFYAALANRDLTAEYIKEAEDDHDEIKHYLGELAVLLIERKEWLERFGEFRHAVIHHVHVEEKIVFPKAEKILNETQIIQLAIDIDKLKQKMLEKAA